MVYAPNETCSECPISDGTVGPCEICDKVVCLEHLAPEIPNSDLHLCVRCWEEELDKRDRKVEVWDELMGALLAVARDVAVLRMPLPSIDRVAAAIAKGNEAEGLSRDKEV